MRFDPFNPADPLKVSLSLPARLLGKFFYISPGWDREKHFLWPAELMEFPGRLCLRKEKEKLFITLTNDWIDTLTAK